jgi:hypothetical protein
MWRDGLFYKLLKKGVDGKPAGYRKDEFTSASERSAVGCPLAKELDKGPLRRCF